MPQTPQLGYLVILLYVFHLHAGNFFDGQFFFCKFEMTLAAFNINIFEKIMGIINCDI